MTKFELLRRNAGNVMGLFWYFFIPLLSIANYGSSGLSVLFEI
jgi:ABC-type polysaccharide/polyol phosphate export permease